MKMRCGFVSNSSSSSFLLITTQKTFDEVISTFEGEEKKFILSILPEKVSFNLDDKKYIQFCSIIYSENMADAAYNISQDINDRYDDIFDDFKNRFNKYKNSYSYDGE